ncbi:MAG: restriction endonuclease subunit S [Nanoarchaeota archaeon]|nr:restriction endonuclease subunit S [Nanoarchaeota archaeon]
MKTKQLPEGWKEIELGEITEFQTKSKIKAGEGNEEGKYKFFTSSDKQSKFIDKYNHNGEFLIFATGGHAGVHYCNEKFATSTDCFIVKIIDKIMTKYIYYYLSGQISLLEDGFKGAGLKHLSKNYLGQIKISYPEDKKTQKQIVSILEKAEELKEKREEADKLTKEYLQSVFYEMFYNKGFEEVELGTVCEFNPKKAEIRDVNKNLEVSFVPMADVQEHQIYFNLKGTEKIRDIFSGYTYFKEKDVLLAKVTPCFENGKSGIAKNLKNGIGFGSSEFFVLRPSNKILSHLIYYLISSSKFIKAGKRQMSGTGGLKRLSKNYVTEYKLPLPPLPLQQKFASIVEQVEKLKEKQQKSKEDIDELFNSLMQKAFNEGLVR